MHTIARPARGPTATRDGHVHVCSHACWKRLGCSWHCRQCADAAGHVTDCTTHPVDDVTSHHLSAPTHLHLYLEALAGQDIMNLITGGVVHSLEGKERRNTQKLHP